MAQRPRIYLKSRDDARLLQGHLWVFSNEIERSEGSPKPGEIIDVYSHRQKFLGRGFYNPKSLIAARLLTTTDQSVSSAFFSNKIRSAKALRESLYPGETSYRLIFGESDGLPGLVIDRFENCFVIQSYCLGMDVLQPLILEALKAHFRPETIILKNDSAVREFEGVAQEVKVLEGEPALPIQIKLKTPHKMLNLLFDPIEGQKTGYFLDQRENRARAAEFCAGKKVLDCFSYVGGFGLYAAAAEASETVCIDSSTQAADLAQKNFEANGLQAEILRGDVFETLEGFAKEKCEFDTIVLDPPAFAKSKKNLFGAMRKYAQLNKQALGILKKGGTLITCSCSHHIRRDDFIKMLGEAAADAGRNARILEIRGQAMDHPIHPSMPETEYLKCIIARID